MLKTRALNFFLTGWLLVFIERRRKKNRKCWKLERWFFFWPGGYWIRMLFSLREVYNARALPITRNHKSFFFFLLLAPHGACAKFCPTRSLLPPPCETHCLNLILNCSPLGGFRSALLSFPWVMHLRLTLGILLVDILKISVHWFLAPHIAVCHTELTKVCLYKTACSRFVASLYHRRSQVRLDISHDWNKFHDIWPRVILRWLFSLRPAASNNLELSVNRPTVREAKGAIGSLKNGKATCIDAIQAVNDVFKSINYYKKKFV